MLKMKMPKLVHAAQIAEIIAAVAVVISLLYVGRQVQSNTAAVRAAAVQAVADRSAEGLMALATDSATSRIRQLGDVDPSALTQAESYRYFLLFRVYWLTMQNVRTQNKLGVFDPGVWAGYLNIICNDLRSPGVRSGWQSHRSALSPEFVDVVEDCSTF